MDLSLTQPTGDPPSAYSVLTFFLLNPDGVNDFLDTVKKINEGIKKTSSPSPVPAPGTSS